MNISIASEKNMWKIANTHSWLKKCQRTRNKKKFPQPVKGNLWEKKTTVKIILNGDRLKPLSLRSGEKAKMYTLNTFVQHHIGGFSQCNKFEKKKHTV